MQGLWHCRAGAEASHGRLLRAGEALGNTFLLQVWGRRFQGEWGRVDPVPNGYTPGCPGPTSLTLRSSEETTLGGSVTPVLHHPGTRMLPLTWPYV